MVAFPRRWLRFATARRWWRPFSRGNRLEFAASKSWNWKWSKKGQDRQFRFYRKDAVNYYPDVHTPDFKIKHAALAPGKAVLFHFDWLLRSKAERLAKVARYGPIFSVFYLPEDVQRWDYSGEIRDKEILDLARRLAGSPQNEETQASDGATREHSS